MSEKKKTAVQWLIEKLDNNLDIKHSWRTRQYIQEAKEMEKEQLIEFYIKGCDDTYGYDEPNGNDYYDKQEAETYFKETYGE